MPDFAYGRTANWLGDNFTLGKETIHPPGGNVVIINTPFRSHALRKNPDLLAPADQSVHENHEFKYITFSPAGENRFSKAVLILHGLNERSWTKYLPWASFLCSSLQRPVVPFPYAFHMNRSSAEWLETENLQNMFSDRKTKSQPDDRLSSVNTVLSERLEHDPLRFFSSGLQTYTDVIDLVRSLTSAPDNGFASDAVFDIFGYSIGAFLWEFLLMCNPQELF